MVAVFDSNDTPGRLAFTSGVHHVPIIRGSTLLSALMDVLPSSDAVRHLQQLQASNAEIFVGCTRKPTHKTTGAVYAEDMMTITEGFEELCPLVQVPHMAMRVPQASPDHETTRTLLQTYGIPDSPLFVLLFYTSVSMMLHAPAMS